MAGRVPRGISRHRTEVERGGRDTCGQRRPALQRPRNDRRVLRTHEARVDSSAPPHASCNPASDIVSGRTPDKCVSRGAGPIVLDRTMTTARANFETLALSAAIAAIALAAPRPAHACIPDPSTGKCVAPPPVSHPYQVTGADSQGLAV